MTGAEERLRTRLAQDLRAAMKIRDSSRIAALRTLIAALDNAAAVPVPSGVRPAPGAPVEVPRKVLDDEEVETVLLREIAERRNAIFSFEMHGCIEEAVALRAEIELYEQYAAELR